MLRGVYSSAPAAPADSRRGAATAHDVSTRVARDAMPASPPRADEAGSLYVQIIEAMSPQMPQNPLGALAFDYGTFAVDGDLVSIPLSRSSVRSLPPHVDASSRGQVTCWKSQACFFGFKVPSVVVTIGGISYLLYYVIRLEESDSAYLISLIALGILDCMMIWAASVECSKHFKRNRVVPA